MHKYDSFLTLCWGVRSRRRKWLKCSDQMVLGFGGPSTPHHLPPNSKALKSWPPLVCKFIESTQWSPRVICFEHNSLLVNNVDLSPHLPLLFYYSTYLKLGRLCRQHFRLSNFKQAYSLFKFFYVVAQILNNFWWIIRMPIQYSSCLFVRPRQQTKKLHSLAAVAGAFL